MKNVNSGIAENEWAEEKFSVSRFLTTIALWFVAFLIVTWLILHALGLDSVWSAQFHSNWWKALGIFLLIQVVNCFGEYPFHRYMLHAPLIPGFRRLFKQHHDIHHRLTNIMPVPKGQPTKWKNNYPIVDEVQYEASYFPWYSYGAFMAFSMLYVIPLQWFLADWPVLVVSTVSLGWSIVMYEIIHMIEHLPMDFWEKTFHFSHRFARAEKIAKGVYSFHLIHHIRLNERFGHLWNQSVSGFVCGIPLADLFFGTFKLSSRLSTDGAPVVERDLNAPTSWCPLIRWLDRKAAESIEKYRQNAQLQRA